MKWIMTVFPVLIAQGWMTCVYLNAYLGRERQYLRHFIAKYKNVTCLQNVRRKDYCNREKNKSAYETYRKR